MLTLCPLRLQHFQTSRFLQIKDSYWLDHFFDWPLRRTDNGQDLCSEYNRMRRDEMDAIYTLASKLTRNSNWINLTGEETGCWFGLTGPWAMDGDGDGGRKIYGDVLRSRYRPNFRSGVTIPLGASDQWCAKKARKRLKRGQISYVKSGKHTQKYFFLTSDRSIRILLYLY